MNIHFVSYGHAFRSRLAEAYLKYVLRKHKDIKVTSSGILPENDLNGPIAWYAMKILSQHALVPYMTLEPVKTTKEMLDQADKIVFTDRHSYEYLKKKFHLNNKNIDIWDLSYIPALRIEQGEDREKDINTILLSESIFDQIQQFCQDIYNDLSVTDIPFKE